MWEPVLSLTPGMRVLYLGAANGTTVSHVADYVEVVYAVEFAPRPMQDLLEVSRRRRNVIPIMADAARPEQYVPLVESVDLIYQDVAQPDQASIALRNCLFLKEGGFLILMLKTRSVNVRKEPAEVFEDTLDVLDFRRAYYSGKCMACPVSSRSCSNYLHETGCVRNRHE